MLKIARPFFAEMFNEEAAVVISEIDAELERLIPEIPYIGSKNNALTDTMEQMTTLLAIYYVLKRHGYSTEEIGSLAQRMGRAWTEQFPRLARRLIGRFYMSVWNRKRAAKKAAVSQERRYAGDFVTEVVAGDGRTYDWGVNYIECGIVKFFRQQGAEEFAPYMCEIDNLLFPAIGIELIRTGTIANGQTHCDFRFKK
ncbi:L-2-amino-thiazoline-4-carboxylic acid hydrolase [Candidatus Leptofilum sp.]|uniref:L-2-amino-thiazoline-4-carboxylic acid hydrolase n=1 Tax=Candidatus Leptofilum sp. TaxID=3241576 RepID=UPI003B5C10DE